MKRLKWFFPLWSLGLLLGLAQFIPAQTAKYNDAGDLIRITRLLHETTGCEPPKTFTGKITKVESFESDNAVGYEFSLRLGTGKTQKLQASITLDEGAVVVDFENLMQKNRQLRVKARQCGSDSFWTVEEIKRL